MSDGEVWADDMARTLERLDAACWGQTVRIYFGREPLPDDLSDNPSAPSGQGA